MSIPPLDTAGTSPPPGLPCHRHPRGFALVVTLSLMILLVVIAVGLLSLSTVSIRTASHGNAAATARANARLALMLAIGELQKTAGPDQRVTARSDIMAANASNGRLTGVWKSREITADHLPTPADYTKAARDEKFLGWLTSSPGGTGALNVGFAATAPTTPTTLWGKGSLGKSAQPADMVSASKVSMSKNRGGFAWAVMDEGVKVRVNTPYSEDATSDGMKTAQLGTGESPNPEMIDGMSAFEKEFLKVDSAKYATIQKGVSRQTFGLVADAFSSGAGENLKPLTHDITTNSLGLFTDTASGGLKEDFQLLTNRATLPASYTANGIYTTRLGLSPGDAPSQPRWESLQQYASLYRDKVINSGGVPMVRTEVPNGWVAASGSNPATGISGTVQKAPPQGMVLMPTIAKVEVLFSLLARDIYSYTGGAGAVIPETAAQLHGPWGDNFRGSSYDYLLHLLYTPVVTLHNPYNVAIEFTNLKVVFSNVPFAVQIYRNNVAQTSALAPLDQMYHQSSELGKVSKRFGMNLKTKTFINTPGSSTFRLMPGEVKLFTPYLPPTRSWSEECTSTRLFWDYDNDANRTINIDGIPGWRGDGFGFDLDWFCPQPLRTITAETENGKSMDRGGCIGMRRQDQWHVLFAPLSLPELSKNKFIVEMFASSGNNPTPISSGAIEMDYESPTGLQDFLIGKNGTIRFPAEDTLNTMEMLDHSSSPIKKYTKVKPFALLSARAKTTSGGQNPDNFDGKLATKPWSFAHANIGSVTEKMTSEHPASQSHELDLQRLENGTNNLLQFGNQDRGNFITGNTAQNGVKFGSIYDIPLAPVQTLSSLNSANPGGGSGYLPRFAQPIGNSWAHPLMSTDKVMEGNPTGNYLDHSFLLNAALYDHFYFSGLAEQTGQFMNGGKATQKLATDFSEGMPLDDPRIMMYHPGGRAASAMLEDVSDPLGHTKIGAWQMMQGAFNINSTSVPAWKAMLGSVRDSQAILNSFATDGITSSLTKLKPTKKGESRISRFRLPGSESEAAGADPKVAYWMGAREYSDDDLEMLAKEIVKQVRKRGPFLSLSDFVNRQVGSANDETSQRGALQQAIDDTNLNDSVAQEAEAGYEILPADVAKYQYKNPAAGAGDSYQGAPGYLTQADLLGVLGNAATPRSDTFTVRGYGEARDPSGKVIATATCEATVQRVPDYLDPSDRPDIVPALLTSAINKNFGRRFNVVSFRWLSAAEV